VFTFGFGSDHNQGMLKGISDATNGNYFFIQKESDIAEAFADCLGGITSVTCEKMELQVVPAEGVTIKKVLGTKRKLVQKTGKDKKNCQKGSCQRRTIL